MTGFLDRILNMPRVVMTVMVLLLGAGTAAYVLLLPKESFPAIDIPYFYVSISQTGVSPRDSERLLVKPVEDRLKDLDGLNNLNATATTGHASVFLEFDVNTDKDEALTDIRAALDGVASELPEDANEPTVHEISFSDIPVLSVALYGDVPERSLIKHAKELQDALEGIANAQDVTISGARDEVLEVRIDLNRLETYDLTAAQLFDAVARNNLVVAGGTLDTGQGSFNVEVPGLITTAEDVYRLPLKSENGTVVTFGEVATITRTFKDATEYAYVNGSPAITIGVVKKIGSNIIDVADEVRAITAEVTADWPAGIEHSFLLDQSVSTQNFYRSLEAAVLTAVALVLIMCVATLGWRPAVMIGSSIPISFMMAFLVFQFLGMTVNMMVMFGLVIAVGVLVDDPIVVVEYAERKLAEGVSKKEAFILAAKKMFVPVVSATATTLGAFVPLLFWPGIIGKFMNNLPITVIVVMAASLISALIFMPIIGAFIARTNVTDEEKEAARLVMYPEEFDRAKVPGLTGFYVRTMSRLLHHPILTMIGGFAIVFSMFFVYAQNPTGVEAFPATEPEYGSVYVIAQGNYSPVEIRDYLLEVEREILQVQGIQDSIMTFGGGGNALGSGNAPPNTIGSFNLQLMPWAERVPAEVIFQNIRDRVVDISGLEIQIQAQEDGPPAGKDINLRVESNIYEDVAPTVARIRDYIENELGNTIEIEDGRPSPGIDWKITVDRELAAEYGIGIRELSPYIQLVTTGVKLGSYRPDDINDELDIRVRLPENERSMSALESMRIATSKGQVPVSNFIKKTAEPKVANITRRNGKFTMPVAANVTGINPETDRPYLASDKVKELQEWLATQDLPESVVIEFGGAEEQIGDTNRFIGQAFAGAMFLIFLILLMEYNSFWQVFVTLSTVIMSTAGVLLGMVVTGMSFSAIMTGLGIVALTGIVVKNGIVLIDTYNHYNRVDKVEPIKAMLLTTSQRIRPVLLTATVTALGVIPMALNIEFDFVRREIVAGGLAGALFVNLAAALVSGLFVSTLLTLIMVPVMVIAPSVIWEGWIGRIIRGAAGGVVRAIGSFLPGQRELAHAGAEIPTPPGEGINSADKYMRNDPTGLVETQRNGVTVVSRQAAE